VTQVFPDEFHLHTLDQFLSAVARLNPHVNVKGIVVGLMDRLSAYAQRESESESPEQRKKNEDEAITNLLEQLKIQKEQKPAEPTSPAAQQNGDSSEDHQPGTEEASVTSSTTAAETPASTTEPLADAEADGEIEKSRGIPKNVKLFEIFNEQVATLVKMQRLSIQDTIGLLVSLANLALNIYPERLDYVDQVLTFANQKVAEYANSADLHSQATQSQILSLLLAPIKTYMSMFTALALPSFIPLLHNQPYPTRRAVAGEVARSLLRNQTHITTVENLESVLEILKVLIKEGMQQAGNYPGGPIQRRAMETDETIEEQGWLARMIHLVHGSDNDTQFKVSMKRSIK
jgi:vacuolar protein sorting-associated protein 35